MISHSKVLAKRPNLLEGFGATNPIYIISQKNDIKALITNQIEVTDLK
jgi:hypothetical protein